MATIRKRDGKNGSSYQVQIRIKDGGIESASFKSLTKAKIWAQSVEASIRDGKHFTKNAAKKHTLSDLIERFLNHPSLKDKTKIVLMFRNFENNQLASSLEELKMA